MLDEPLLGKQYDILAAAAVLLAVVSLSTIDIPARRATKVIPETAPRN
jgi:hypothetical protein